MSGDSIAVLALSLAAVVAVVWILVQAGERIGHRLLEHAKETVMVGGKPMAIIDREADLAEMRLEIEKAKEEVRGKIAGARLKDGAAPPAVDIHN